MNKYVRLLLIGSVLVLAAGIWTGIANLSGPAASKDPQEDSTVQKNPSDEQQEQTEPQTQKPGLADFLQTAFQPAGDTLYIWGGGWNEEDTGAGPDATHIGVSPVWQEFMDSQSGGYDFSLYPYQIHNGLDCSGFLGWSLYNTLETQDGQEGYVVNARNAGEFLSSKGWGTITPADQITDYKAGDIMFNEGHVYIVLGQYPDGSLLILHSAPPGVQVSGTPDPAANYDSDAARQAASIMQIKSPRFASEFGSALVDTSYLRDYDQFRWNDALFSDAAAVQAMSPAEVSSLLIESIKDR